MTTYIAISDPETDPDAPLTAELAKKWRDNPLAVAEADSTAPVNQGNWHPYNKVTNGDSNDGVFYDFAVSGALASVQSPIFADGYEYMVRGLGLSCTTGGAFQVEGRRESDAAYNAAVTVFNTISGATILSFEMMCPTVRLSQQMHVFPTQGVFGGASNGGIAGVTGTWGHAQATAQKVQRLRFSYASGNIDAGQMILLRRRLIV
jgi:hypothetical protein